MKIGAEVIKMISDKYSRKEFVQAVFVLDRMFPACDTPKRAGSDYLVGTFLATRADVGAFRCSYQAKPESRDPFNGDSQQRSDKDDCTVKPYSQAFVVAQA